MAENIPRNNAEDNKSEKDGLADLPNKTNASVIEEPNKRKNPEESKESNEKEDLSESNKSVTDKKANKDDEKIYINPNQGKISNSLKETLPIEELFMQMCS